jgi:hypothetical protein
MFAHRLAGASVATIARILNEQAVACPSQVDRARNPHRRGEAWTVRTVAAIMANPRYTGRQVWNRQSTDPTARSGRHRRRRAVQRWNPIEDWVISKTIAHPALVSERDWVTAQAIRSTRETGDGTIRRYHLAGLLRCGLCGRRMDAHWVNARAGYRCRHGHTTGTPQPAEQPKNLYLREDHIIDMLPARLADLIPATNPKPGPDTSDHDDPVALLHHHGLIITCTRAGWTIGPRTRPANPA